jgi:hypothetical protein
MLKFLRLLFAKDADGSDPPRGTPLYTPQEMHE